MMEGVDGARIHQRFLEMAPRLRATRRKPGKTSQDFFALWKQADADLPLLADAG